MVERDPSTLKQAHYQVALVLSDPMKSQALAQQLQDFGYNTVIYPDFNALIQATTESLSLPIGIIVLEFTFFTSLNKAQIKTLSEKIPLICLSENQDIRSRLFAVESGSQAYIVPPIELTNLIETIDRLTTPYSEQPPFRILVVEDSKTHATFIAKILKEAGMIVEILMDPLNIQECIEHFAPDLILLDFYMPVCSGPDLAKVIRQQDQFIGIPIVYLSAEDDAAKQLEALRDGGDDFLTKPVPLHKLITVVTARAQRSRILRAEMIRDGLTGLLNHTHILEQLDLEMARANRLKTDLCFVMIDLDHFKEINDTYGHNIGDQIIQGLARLLKQRLRKSDIAGRYGGEEFALIIPNATANDVEKLVNQIREGFSQLTFHLGENQNPIFASFSAGVAAYDPQMQTLDQFVQAADKALYEAKAQGRNCVVKYAPHH